VNDDSQAALAPRAEEGEPAAVPDARGLEMEILQIENDRLRELLDRAHDVMVHVMNDMCKTRQKLGADKRRKRLKAAGSCVQCGVEAIKQTTRCGPCGRKNSALTKRLAAERQSGAGKEE
jgi:hypothetical protein